MNVVDSSGWISFLREDQHAGFFAEPIMDADSLVVPTIVMHEVVKVLRRGKQEEIAFKAVAFMRRGRIAPLDEEIALTATTLGLEHKLAACDSFILATARRYQAVLWTTDIHFKGLSGVKLFDSK